MPDPAGIVTWRMAKYDPLYRYLRRQAGEEIILTFSEIENLLTTLLPKRAGDADWWAPGDGSRQDNPQCRAWRAAGFEAGLCGRERVVFRRVSQGDASNPALASRRFAPACQDPDAV